LQFRKGTPRKCFQHYLKETIAENWRRKDKDKLNDDGLLSKVFNLVANDVFKMEHAHRRQLNFMRYKLYMGTTHVQEFMARLVKMNEYIPYFPDKPNGN
jgi:predicted metal-dependent peptidase